MLRCFHNLTPIIVNHVVEPHPLQTLSRRLGSSFSLSVLTNFIRCAGGPAKPLRRNGPQIESIAASHVGLMLALLPSEPKQQRDIFIMSRDAEYVSEWSTNEWRSKYKTSRICNS